MGEVCILHFVRLIKPFVGEESFCFLSFVCLQEGIKTCCTSKGIHIIQQLNIAEIEQDKVVRFFDNSRYNITFVNKNG